MQVPCECAILIALFLPDLPGWNLGSILVSLARCTVVSFACSGQA